jgi:hypothetical protein
VFCQWCAKELDPDAIAIHHCGPTARPPAYCRQCGQALGDGAAACTACGTPPGELPRPAAPSVRVVPASEAHTALGAGSVGGATTATARTAPAVQRGHAPAPTSDGYLRSLRIGLLATSVIGTLAFFVPWGELTNAFPDNRFGASIGLFGGYPDGVSLVEFQRTHWWDAPSANVMGVLVLVALVGSIAMVLGVRGRVTAAVVGLAGLGLTVCCADWIWLGRRNLAMYTGFWVVAASGVLLCTLSALYVLHRADGT